MKRLPFALFTAALLLAGPALAIDDWKDKVKDKGATPAKEEPARQPFSTRERSQIDGYFKTHPEARKQLPPGLAKKSKVPPGWQKKLAPGQRVPDDIWERRVALPKDLKLPDEKGVIRVRIDDRVVKVAEKTREVIDVLNLP